MLSDLLKNINQVYTTHHFWVKSQSPHVNHAPLLMYWSLIIPILLSWININCLILVGVFRKSFNYNFRLITISMLRWHSIVDISCISWHYIWFRSWEFFFLIWLLRVDLFFCDFNEQSGSDKLRKNSYGYWHISSLSYW